MAIGESIRAWRRGEDWNHIFGYLYISQADIDAGKAAASKLDELNRSAFERGLWTQDQYNAAQGRAAASTIPAMLDQPDTSPWDGFKTGWAEGQANVQSAIKKGLAWPINFTLASIPWQIWAGLALYVAWKLGWLGKAMAKLKTR